jgi:DNA-binding CsgD family transcriptional regulator
VTIIAALAEPCEVFSLMMIPALDHGCWPPGAVWNPPLLVPTMRLLGRPVPRRRLPRHRPAASAHAGPMTIQVILADDQPLVRAGLRRLIEQESDIEVAGEAGTGAGAVQLVRDAGPDKREVLRLVGLGMSNAEIAAALYITAGTAKTHVARLLAKLCARDRVQLVIAAYQAGLVDT